LLKLFSFTLIYNRVNNFCTRQLCTQQFGFYCFLYHVYFWITLYNKNFTIFNCWNFVIISYIYCINIRLSSFWTLKLSKAHDVNKMQTSIQSNIMLLKLNKNNMNITEINIRRNAVKIIKKLYLFFLFSFSFKDWIKHIFNISHLNEGHYVKLTSILFNIYKSHCKV